MYPQTDWGRGLAIYINIFALPMGLLQKAFRIIPEHQNWFGFMIHCFSGSEFVCLSDQSLIVALSCQYGSQFLRPLVKTWLMWLWRVNIRTTSPKDTQPLSALPAVISFDSHVVDIRTNQKPCYWCRNKTKAILLMLNFWKGSNQPVTPTPRRSEWSLSLEILCMYFILSGHHTYLHISNHLWCRFVLS